MGTSASPSSATQPGTPGDDPSSCSAIGMRSVAGGVCVAAQRPQLGQQALARTTPPGQDQERVRVELLAQQVVHGRDVLAGIAPVGTACSRSRGRLGPPGRARHGSRRTPPRSPQASRRPGAAPRTRRARRWRPRPGAHSASSNWPARTSTSYGRGPRTLDPRRSPARLHVHARAPGPCARRRARAPGADPSWNRSSTSIKRFDHQVSPIRAPPAPRLECRPRPGWRGLDGGKSALSTIVVRSHPCGATSRHGTALLLPDRVAAEPRPARGAPRRTARSASAPPCPPPPRRPPASTRSTRCDPLLERARAHELVHLHVCASGRCGRPGRWPGPPPPGSTSGRSGTRGWRRSG